jgi:uncharacterized damage-inducible protein DinB
MIRTIADFERLWQVELEATQKVLKHLTTKSLTEIAHPDIRTLGRLAWHIVTSMPEMAGRTGLRLAGPDEHAPVPATAREIFDAYNSVAVSLMETVKSSWTDADLLREDEMYGKKWARGFTLQVLVHHQIHHRAQMTVLMRLQGLGLPGVYGPTKEEWSSYGMQPPAV